MVKVKYRSKIPVLCAESVRLQHIGGPENAPKSTTSVLLAWTLGDVTVLDQPTYHGSDKL